MRIRIKYQTRTKNKLIVYENMYNISDSHKNQLKKEKNQLIVQRI